MFLSKKRRTDSNKNNYANSRSISQSNEINDNLSSLIMLAKQKDPRNHSKKRSIVIDNCIEPTIVQEKDQYPYQVIPDDHCETPEIAYKHIAPILSHIAIQIEKTPNLLKLYDPYFCEGAVKERLKSFGFENVYNEKEDFYAKQLDNTVPEYDVLVTNPPYSSDHIEKLLSYCIGIQKPWFLLLPNYVYMKEYFRTLFNNRINDCLYIVPTKRYLYTTPKGRRQKKSSKYTSPFTTFWYCGGLKWYNLDSLKSISSEEVKIFSNLRNLPREIMSENDPFKKLKKNKNNKRFPLKIKSSNSSLSSK